MSVECSDGFLPAGDPARGILTGIGPLKWNSERPCWRLKLREGAEFREPGAEEFEFRALSASRGEFRHRTLPLTLSLGWRPGEAGEAVCTLGFTAGEGVEVAELGFRLGGLVRVAADGEEDVLLYPFATGLRIPSPAETVFAGFRRYDTCYGPAKRVRHLNVIRSGLPAVGAGSSRSELHEIEPYLNDYLQYPDSDVFEWGYARSHSYPGGTSMTWMDYSGPGAGIALSAIASGFEKALLYFRAERKRKGIELGLCRVFNRPQPEWSGDFILAATGGDWRESARRYRARIDAFLPPAITAPRFFREAPGAITHYDFKWEDGTVHHRFAELPELYREAKALGFDTLLLAGWNRGGFDNFEFRYQPDPELGTEEELRQAIAEVRAAGGHVLLYVNVQCIAADGPDYAAEGEACVVRHPDGSPERFGENYLLHPLAVLCPESPAWRERVKRNIRYGILELGADGLYLDQIGSPPRECYGEHAHRHSWVGAYRSLLQEVRCELAGAGAGEYLFLTEYPMDAYRDLIDCFLCYSYWQAATQFCFPAMFRETLPEVQLIDMTMQKPWRGRNPVESGFAGEIFCRQFIEGVKFWSYCHAPGNPGLSGLFPEAVRLRKLAKEFFADGRALGDRNILDASPGLAVREFRLGERRLFTVWNPSGEPAAFRLRGKAPDSASVLDSGSESFRKTGCRDGRIPAGNARLALVEV